MTITLYAYNTAAMDPKQRGELLLSIGDTPEEIRDDLIWEGEGRELTLEDEWYDWMYESGHYDEEYFTEDPRGIPAEIREVTTEFLRELAAKVWGVHPNHVSMCEVESLKVVSASTLVATAHHLGMEMKELAEALDVGRDTMRAWATARRDTPPWLRDELNKLITEQDKAVEWVSSRYSGEGIVRPGYPNQDDTWEEWRYVFNGYLGAAHIPARPIGWVKRVMQRVTLEKGIVL